MIFTKEDNIANMFLVNIMTLKEVRLSFGLSQKEASDVVNVPVRTYRRYEKDEAYGSTFKRQRFIEILNSVFEITEDKGLLKIDGIKESLTKLFDSEYKNEISFCYLFGSYAKGLAKEDSDVDLYISSSLTGLRFVGLIEKCRQVLHKRIDLIRDSELKDNIDLVNEIMKYGIRIYG